MIANMLDPKRILQMIKRGSPQGELFLMEKDVSVCGRENSFADSQIGISGIVGVIENFWCITSAKNFLKRDLTTEKTGFIM